MFLLMEHPVGISANLFVTCIVILSLAKIFRPVFNGLLVRFLTTILSYFTNGASLQYFGWIQLFQFIRFQIAIKTKSDIFITHGELKRNGFKCT